MFRSIFFLLFAITFSTGLAAQDMPEIPELKTTKDYHIDGPVNSLYEITYAVRFENRILQDSTVYVDTLLSRNKETNILFDTAGRLLSHKVDSFDQDAKTIHSYEVKYHYDGDRIISMLNFQDGKLVDSTFIGYDRRGLADEQLFFDRKGKLLKKVQYFYRYGKIFNVKVRDEDGLLVTFIRYEYDDSGNLREQEIKGSTMQYLHSYKYRYDTLKDGSRQVNKYDYIGKYKYKSMVRYLEDPLGNITELIVTDSNKRVTENHTMKYYPNGLLKSELVFTMYKNEYKYRYEYANGYWKTKYVTVNDKLVEKTHRVVELYKKEG